MRTIMIPKIIFYKNVEYINVYAFDFVLKTDTLIKYFWDKFNEIYKLKIISSDHFKSLYSSLEKSQSLDKFPKFIVDISSIDYSEDDSNKIDIDNNEIDYDKLFYISIGMLKFVFTNNRISFK